MAKKELIKIIYVSAPLALAPLLGLIFQILVAREASIEMYGQLSLVLTLSGLATALSDFGLRDYLLSKEGLSKPYVTPLNLLIFSFLGLQVWLLSSIAYFQGDLTLVFILMATLGELFSLAVLHKSIYLRYQFLGNLVGFSKIDVMLKLITVGLKIFIFWIERDLIVALFCSSCVSVISYCVWSYSARIFSGFPPHRFRDSFFELLRDYRSWGVFTISVSSYLLFFGLDKLVIEAILGVDQLARYNSAMIFMAIGQLFTNVLWTLYMPRLSRGEIFWTLKTVLYGSCIFGCIVALGYQVFAIFVFPTLLPEYRDNWMVLSVASCYFVFRFPNVFIEIQYILEYRYRTYVLLRLMFGLSFLLALYFLLPTFGLIGASFLLVAAEFLLLVCARFFLGRCS